MERWVVVGAGAAGCVVASRLSERGDRTVTVVEAGLDHPISRPPADAGAYLADPARVRDDAVVVARPGAAPRPYPQGLGLGGSSLINAGVVVAAAVPPAAHHLLPLEPPERHGVVGAATLAAAPDATELLHARRGGVRVTAADAYLRPVLGRPNLTVMTGVPVDRVVLDGRRALGVATVRGDEIDADVVVLCAGAIHTPAILLRSGVDAPGVGRGLQDHPAVAITLELAEGAADPSVPTPSVSIERTGRQIVALDHLPDAPRLGALMAACTRVGALGSVTLPDPEGPPHVDLGLLDREADVDALATAAIEALDLADHPRLRAVVVAAHLDAHGTPATRLRSDPEAVRAWVPTALGGYHHVAGSCRIGTTTDDRGAVLGAEGLVVCDASLHPGVPAANPYLATILLAERVVARW